MSWKKYFLFEQNSHRTKTLDLLPLNLLFFIVKNGNFVLEISWKTIFPWLREPCPDVTSIEARQTNQPSNQSTWIPSF